MQVLAECASLQSRKRFTEFLGTKLNLVCGEINELHDVDVNDIPIVPVLAMAV